MPHMTVFLKGMIIIKFNAEMMGPVSFTKKNEIRIRYVKENTELLELGFSQTTGVPLRQERFLVINKIVGEVKVVIRKVVIDITKRRIDHRVNGTLVLRV